MAEFLEAVKGSGLSIEPLTAGGAGVVNISDPLPRQKLREADVALREARGDRAVLFEENQTAIAAEAKAQEADSLREALASNDVDGVREILTSGSGR